MVINNDGVIEDISCSCINLLKLEIKKVASKDYRIIDIIPNYDEIKNQILDKNGFITTIKEFPVKS